MSEFSLLLTGFVYGIITVVVACAVGVLLSLFGRKLFSKKKRAKKIDRNGVNENGKSEF